MNSMLGTRPDIAYAVGLLGRFSSDPSIEHWMAVRAGQPLGCIVSPHRGGVLSEVRSPVDGVLFTLREYPVVYEGSLLARIMAQGS